MATSTPSEEDQQTGVEEDQSAGTQTSRFDRQDAENLFRRFLYEIYTEDRQKTAGVSGSRNVPNFNSQTSTGRRTGQTADEHPLTDMISQPKGPEDDSAYSSAANIGRQLALIGDDSSLPRGRMEELINSLQMPNTTVWDNKMLILKYLWISARSRLTTTWQRIQETVAGGPQTETATESCVDETKKGRQSAVGSDEAENLVSMEIAIPITDPKQNQNTLMNPILDAKQPEDTRSVSIDRRTGQQEVMTFSPSVSDVESEVAQDNDPPPPMVCRCWQHTHTVNNDGGLFQKSGSDVILHAPLDAVPKDSSVAVSTTVCADVDRVRRVLELRDEEQIISPLVEFWAGSGFRFSRPVSIRLLQSLPQNCDLSLLRVYRVSSSDDQVFVTRMRYRPDDRIDDDTVTSVRDSGSNSKPDVPGVKPTDSTEPTQTQTSQESADLQEGKTSEQKQNRSSESQPVDYPWETSGFFMVSLEGQVDVVTDQFSGYVCTYCGQDQGPPELVALVYGSHERMPNGQRLGEVDLYVWDRRMDIADFRQEYGIGLNGTMCGRTVLRLLEDLRDTQLLMKLHVVGPSAAQWDHCRDRDGHVVNSIEQVEDLKYLLSCDAKGCHKKRSAPPLLVQWQLMTEVNSDPGPVLVLLLNISHISSDQQSSKTTGLRVKMPEAAQRQIDSQSTDREQWRHLLSAFSTAQLEVVVEDLDLAAFGRLQRKKHRYKNEEDYRRQLEEICYLHDSSITATIAALMPSSSDPEPETEPQNNFAATPSGTARGTAANRRTLSPTFGTSFDSILKGPERATIHCVDLSDHRSLEQESQKESPKALMSFPIGSDALSPPKLNQKQQLQQRTQRPASTQPPPPAVDAADRGSGTRSSGTQVVQYVTRLRQDTTGRLSGTVLCKTESQFQGIAPADVSSVVPSLQGSALPVTSAFTSLLPDQDTTFNYIDREIILMVAKQLSTDGTLNFFLDLGLAYGQFQAVNKKHAADPVALNLECLMAWCHSKGREATTDKLIQALDTIERRDIAEEVENMLKKE